MMRAKAGDTAPLFVLKGPAVHGTSGAIRDLPEDRRAHGLD
jgi:hypothetical protein